MEQRIDPLEFSRAAEWRSPRDRERKMAEYHVLQTDIEAHGRIVKLVLGLCEDLSLSPGLYDVQHALRVAKGLERRWHQVSIFVGHRQCFGSGSGWIRLLWALPDPYFYHLRNRIQQLQI